MQETSITLLERLRNCPDDKVAWGRLNDLYRPWILGWLHRDETLGDDAEDLVQEILSVVFQELPGFERRRTGAFRKWLRMITAYRLKEYYRNHRSGMRLQGVEMDKDSLLQLADDRSDLAQRWDQEYNEHIIRQLLNLIAPEFSDTDLRAFRLVVMGEVKPAVAAEELGVSVNVVLLAKSRILKRMRELGKDLLD